MKKNIELTLNQINKTFITIKSGDRTPLLTGKFFDNQAFFALSEKELWEVRKFIKENIVALQKESETLSLSERKNNDLKILLWDQLKYTIQTHMDKKEKNKEKNTLEM